MNYDDCIYLTATTLARAADLDTRNKERKAFEETAYLEQTKGKRMDLFAGYLPVHQASKEPHNMKTCYFRFSALDTILDKDGTNGLTDWRLPFSPL
jgi:hypothetical protein